MRGCGPIVFASTSGFGLPFIPQGLSLNLLTTDEKYI